MLGTWSEPTGASPVSTCRYFLRLMPDAGHHHPGWIVYMFKAITLKMPESAFLLKFSTCSCLFPSGAGQPCSPLPGFHRGDRGVMQVKSVLSGGRLHAYRVRLEGTMYGCSTISRQLHTRPYGSSFMRTVEQGHGVTLTLHGRRLSLCGWYNLPRGHTVLDLMEQPIAEASHIAFEKRARTREPEEVTHDGDGGDH